MGQITLYAEASITIDGATHEQSTTAIADVRSVVRFTSDLGTAFRTLSSTSFSFALIQNVGDEEVFISWPTSGGNKISTGIPIAGHILIVGRTGDDANGVAIGTTIEGASLTAAGSRVVITIGTNASND